MLNQHAARILHGQLQACFPNTVKRNVLFWDLSAFFPPRHTQWASLCGHTREPLHHPAPSPGTGAGIASRLWCCQNTMVHRARMTSAGKLPGRLSPNTLVVSVLTEFNPPAVPGLPVWGARGGHAGPAPCGSPGACGRSLAWCGAQGERRSRVLCAPLLPPAPESHQRPPCLLWVSHYPAAASLGLRRGRQRARVPSDPLSWGLMVIGTLLGRPKAGAWEQDSPAAAEVELRPPPALGLVCVCWRPRSRPAHALWVSASPPLHPPAVGAVQKRVACGKTRFRA